ncbi:hypothetical protein Tco_0090396 [Tanacetum coccineum]
MFEIGFHDEDDEFNQRFGFDASSIEKANIDAEAVARRVNAFNIKNSMSMLVQKSQDHKKARDHKMMMRDCAWLMISKKF